MLGELSQFATPTLGGLLGICVLLVLTGRLVPISTLRREVGAETRRAEDWKEAAALERKAREIQAAKDDEILDLLRAMNARPAAQRETA